PVVWCWSRRPVVLLPVEFASSPKESAWLGVFCHELAHWKRHDHVSSLAIELLCCAVPWQPLAWWAARRHHELSELACDEWVLACGQSAESYADSLLDLVPQRGAALALAVLRNRAGLARRIRHILDVVHARPRLGARWLAMLSSSTLVLIVLTALAQERPLAADDAPAAAANAEDTKTDSASLQNINEPLQQVGGVVLDLAEKPVAGARVYWVGLAAGEGASRYDPRHVYKLEPLAVGMTDERGRFAMSARFDLNAYQFPSVVVRHRSHGLGLRSELLDKERPPLKIYLPDATPIQGRILNANGMPVAGAEVLPVHLAALSRRAKSTAAKSAKAGSEDDGVWGWLTLSDDARRDGDLPDFWPRPVKTDVDGRFTIPGGDNCGEVLLRISAEGFGPHGVDVVDAAEVAEWSKGNSDPERSPPLANNFTLFLEPPRAIEGAVTDAETGRPVAGMEIVMAAQRASGNVWNHHIARATSDAQGRYRFLTPATGHDQSLTFYPPLGYAAPQMRYYPERAFAELFGDGRVYRYDIHLNRGRIVRGRVIDADTKEPVSDAEVAFQLGPGNPNIGNRDYAFSQRVLTDGGGRFQITAFSGPGVISAMTSSDQYIRTVIPPEVRSGRSYEIPNAFAAVDLPATGETPSMELAVRRGKELLVELIGPDGRPVAKVKIASH
ncbi:MAG TPA: M56 family metallopeptidase, partial [Pirellulales bacterium]